jgi:gliding motility-associated-like protein
MNLLNNTNMTRNALFVLMLLASSQAVLAQMQTTAANVSPFTPQNLISNVFLGSGVEVNSITYNGDPIAVGYFTNAQSVIGIDRGILLTTGRANGTTPAGFGANADGGDFASNDNSGGNNDPNLGPLSTEALRDVAAYTIVFTPTSDTLRFRYCFASEEYPEYACSAYNDIFGFFISGPGFPSPTNIAYIPGSNFLPVAINNIHPANSGVPGCGPLNVQYYNNNNGSMIQPVYDGFTDVFTAQAIVQPCAQYTIRLVIADVFDAIYDSGVFLEAKSFGTGSLRAELATPTTDGTVTEGCATGTLTFRIPTPETTNTPLDYVIWGNASNGTDYQAIPDDLMIPAGQTEIVVPIIGFEDGVAEGPEFIGVDYQKNACERDTVYIFIRENALLPPQLPLDTVACTGTALTLDATLPIPLPVPPTFINTTDLNITPVNTPLFTNINVFGVQPTTLGPGVIRSVCINATHPFVDDLDIYLISPGGQFIELTTDNGADGDNYTNTCFTPVATQVINYGFVGAPSIYAPFTGDFAPEGVWSDLWGGPTNGQWRLQVLDDSNGSNGAINDWTITFEPLYEVNYQWSPSTGLSCTDCPVTNAMVLQNVNYTVVATDSYGCSVSDTITVDPRPQLAPPVIECGSGSGSTILFEWDTIPNAQGYEVNVNGSGWVPAMTDTLQTILNIPLGTPVDIEVRGTNPTYQCAALIGSATCFNCAPPVVSIDTDSVTCADRTDGRAVLTATGSNPPFQYRLGAISNSTGIFTGLSAGNYSVDVVDNIGCDTTVTFTILGPLALTATTNMQQSVLCFGQNQGMLTAIPLGGTSQYTFTWSGTTAQTNQTATNLTAGTYTVTVTDARGCTVAATGTVTQPTLLTVNATRTNATCFGTPTGTALGTPSGGTSGYSFSWSNGTVLQQAVGLVAGIYTVTTTDANNCSATASVTISQPTALTTTISNTPATCSGVNNGTATVVPSGGTIPYQFTWSNGQNTNTANNLAPQNYSVTVTDANLCTSVAQTNITAPDAVVLGFSQDSVTCRGGSNGSATVVPTGGNAPYTYIWSVPQTTSTITNLPSGLYTVTVRDFTGCVEIGSVFVLQPDVLLTFGSSTPVSCFGRTDGRAKIDVTGGTPPYSYLWNIGETFPGIINKTAGTYTVTVTDAAGCTITQTVTIGTPSEIVANISTSPVLCYDGSTGSIQSQITGGAGGYFITWTGPNQFASNDNNLSDLYAGTYNLSVSDANGCSMTRSVQVTQPTAPLQAYPYLVSDTICFDAADGATRMNVIGGTTPYAYTWDDSLRQTSLVANGLEAGVYRVTVTDANGCYVIDSTYILQKAPIFAYIEQVLPSCHDGTDGYAEVSFISYGSVEETDRSIFSYRWSTNPAQLNIRAVGLSANATYLVTVTDRNGCSTTQTITIGNRPELMAGFANVSQVRCHGTGTGQAQAIGQGGTPPYTFLWSPNVGANQTDSLIQQLTVGSYRVTVTDSEGCTSIETLTMTEPSPIVPDYVIENSRCFADSTGSVIVNLTGGVTPYSITWSNGDVGRTADGLPAEFVYATITDANDCQLTDSILVQGPSSPLGGVVEFTAATCFGSYNGEIIINGSGGTPPYQYALDNRPWNGSTKQIGLGAGQYGPQVRDQNGCILAFQPVVIQSRPPVDLDLGTDITIELGEDTQIFSDVSNAADPYIISWEPLDSTWLSCLICDEPNVIQLYDTRTFSAQVVDDLGCVAEDQITINVEKPRKIFVPTGFSPNTDTNNDLLLVHGQSSARVVEFKIFDRWGELVYQDGDFMVNDNTKGWDGTFKGKPMNPGVFVWTLQIEFLDGTKERYHGQTTLIR